MKKMIEPIIKNKQNKVKSNSVRAQHPWFSQSVEDSSSKEPYKSFTEPEDNGDWTKAKYECENRCW